MKFSKVIFDKDLYDLEFTDLVLFFKFPKEETLNLEFKSFVAQGDYTKKEETIKKSTCALLNSEGGIIVWGAPIEVRDTKGNTTTFGALTPFNSKLDKDRLVNILTSSITPLPLGIRVKVLTNVAGDSIFIMEVEKSIDRPHQYDNRYFVRLDGQTRIAPHYIISALMKSKNFPILRGHIRLKSIDHEGDNILLYFRKLLFNTSLFVNDVNVYMSLIATPGNLIVDNVFHEGEYRVNFPIISYGSPFLTDFYLTIPSSCIYQEITLLFQFGGEKSPSKSSMYKYKINGRLTFGTIHDESEYLIEKSENKFPFDISNNSVDQNIEIILNS